MKLFILSLIVSSVLQIATSSLTSSFDLQSANAAVYLTAQAYCQESYYFAREYGHEVEDFVPTLSLSHKSGLVGYSANKHSIYAVLRGDKSLSDLIDQKNPPLIEYKRCKDCQVHREMYIAEKQNIDDITNEVIRLRAVHPTFPVVVTGHGVGGGLATLTAIDLAYAGIGGINLISFGAPKIGNPQFASFAVSSIPGTRRITHDRDVAPHFPTGLNYEHVVGEWYEDSHGVLRGCHGVSDSRCSAKWPLVETSLADHMRYLGQEMRCDAYEQQNFDPIGHHYFDTFGVGSEVQAIEHLPTDPLHTNKLGPGDVYHGPVIVDEQGHRPHIPEIPDLHGKGASGSVSGAFVGSGQTGDIREHGAGSGAASGGWHEDSHSHPVVDIDHDLGDIHGDISSGINGEVETGVHIDIGGKEGGQITWDEDKRKPRDPFHIDRGALPDGEWHKEVDQGLIHIGIGSNQPDLSHSAAHTGGDVDVDWDVNTKQARDEEQRLIDIGIGKIEPFKATHNDDGDGGLKLPHFSGGGGGGGGGSAGGSLGDFHGGGSVGGAVGGHVSNSPQQHEPGAGGIGGICVGIAGEGCNKNEADKHEPIVGDVGGIGVGALGGKGRGENQAKSEGNVDIHIHHQSEQEGQLEGLHLDIKCGGGEGNKEIVPSALVHRIDGVVRCGGGSGAGDNEDAKLIPPKITKQKSAGLVEQAQTLSTPVIVTLSLLMALVCGSIIFFSAKLLYPYCTRRTGTKQEYQRIVELKEVPMTRYDGTADDVSHFSKV